MRIIPWIGGLRCSVILFACVLLLAPARGRAQEGTGTGTIASPAEPAVTVGGGSLSAGEVELVSLPPPAFNFVKPASFNVIDRPNDEGGALALIWDSSPSDSVTTQDPETGESAESPGGIYWPFHSTTGEPGSWERMNPVPSNTSYTWEAPQYFGFFLSERNRGRNTHYTVYENQYPSFGIYEYSIEPDENDPTRVHVRAALYDDRFSEADYASQPVFVNLEPVGGEKVQLTYVQPEPDKKPWENYYEATAAVDTSHLLVTKAVYVLFSAPGVKGMRAPALALQLSQSAPDAPVTISGSANEPPVPDNRDKHFFRLYVVPPDYEIPAVISYGPTPEGSSSYENARVIAAAINAERERNPYFYIAATANPDGTLTLRSDNPLQREIYVLNPGSNPTGLDSIGSPDQNGAVTTTTPVGEGELAEDSIHITTSLLPPDEYMVGSQIDNMVAVGNWWNFSRTNSWVAAILMTIAVLGFINLARKGRPLFVRRIAGLDHVDEAIGRATEMGRPMLYITGIGVMSDIATIASVNILGRVARKAADYESRLLVPSYDPIVMAVCQEVVQEAFIDAGRPDAYKKDDIFYLTSDQFAYAAAVDGIMLREKPATNFLIGVFYAESLLIAETGASTGAIQIAGTDMLHQLPFFVTACDYTLIGEELYAASAYLSREPLLLGSLKGQDLAKAVLMVLTLIGTIMIFFSDKAPWMEFVQKLFQAF